MSTLTLAAKDFRLLRRDYRSAIILLATPLIFVAVLSVVVGEGFGQKPDDRLRVSVVNEDRACRRTPGRSRPSRGARSSSTTWPAAPTSGSN